MNRGLSSGRSNGWLARTTAVPGTPGFEIIVVDGGSTDGTPDLVVKFAADYANIRLLANSKRLSSAARNIAIRRAGRRVAFG